MYDELVKRLRELHPEEFGNAWDFAFACQQTMHEAADAIEELQKARDAACWGCKCKKMEPTCWIPVTERLPEEGEFVLVYGDFYPNKHDGGVIAVSKRMDWNYWQGFGREIDITHWMPLPSTEGLNET